MKDQLLKHWENYLAKHLGAVSSPTHTSHMLGMTERILEDVDLLERLVNSNENAKKYLADSDNGRLGNYSDEEFIEHFNCVAPVWGRYVHPLAKFVLLSELINRIDGAKKVLDVGCGYCLYTTFLAKQGMLGAELFGLDPSEHMIGGARQIAIEENVKTDFQVGFGQSMPYENKSFDLVFALDSLHWTMQWRLVLKEMIRVLADDGQILIGYTVQPNFRSNPDPPEIIQIMSANGVDVDQYAPVYDDEGCLAKVIIGGAKRKPQSLIIVPENILY